MSEHVPIKKRPVLAALIILAVAVAVFFATTTLLRVPENCGAINKVNDRLDKLVAFSAAGPTAHVDDPQIQAIIDNGVKRNEEFKALDARLSKEAQCHA